MADHQLDRSQQRLADELSDDGIVIEGDEVFRGLLLSELDYCRRTPVFEGRQPNYGAIIDRVGLSANAPQPLLDQFDFDIVPLDEESPRVRAYADGRATYLMHDVAGGIALACFESALLFEADLVRLQEVTGAAIIQRTPVLNVVRLFVDGAVISWDGRNWQSRPTASALCARLDGVETRPGGRLADILELAVHWLAPSRVGATIVVPHGGLRPESLDVSTAVHTPALSVTNRRHFAALVAVLQQHDLAVVVDVDGTIRKVAVGLRWSDEAERVVDQDRGMRHRSAQRFSYDHPDATVVVVSADGPVTVFRHGVVVVTTGSDAEPITNPAGWPA